MPGSVRHRLGDERVLREASLASTLKVLEEVLPHLNAEEALAPASLWHRSEKARSEVQKVAAAPSSLGKEPEWEASAALIDTDHLLAP